MFGEKGCELVKGDICELVVKINMPRVRNDVEFPWFCYKPVGVFTEVPFQRFFPVFLAHGVAQPLTAVPGHIAFLTRL